MKMCIRDRAGRYYYVNGKTVKLKGVNRHESNPSVGHAITRKMMEDEVMLMKRANINHVRNSHYPVSYTHLDVYKRQLNRLPMVASSKQ